MFDNKPLLSLELEGLKPRQLKLDLFGGKILNSYIKRVKTPATEECDESFYGDSTIIDDEDALAAVDYFSCLPTPDVMKTFTGHNLNLNKTSLVGTPTREGNHFVEETLVNIPQKNQDDNNVHDGMDLSDILASTERTPQPSLGSSLDTPVVDLNRPDRHPLAGHLMGLAPTPSMGHDHLTCESPAIQHVAHNTHTNLRDENLVMPTHYMVMDENDTFESSVLSSSTSSYVAPSSLSFVDTHGNSIAPSTSIATFTELQTRQAPTSVEQSCSDLMPTVIQDHFYSIRSPASTTQYTTAASPAPSSASLVSSVSDHRDLPSSSRLLASGESSSAGNKRKASSQSESGAVGKKPRLTKKQAFLELMAKETELSSENERLRRHCNQLEVSCKKMKQMLMAKIASC